MMVHRLLQRYFDGGKSVSADKYEEMCEHSSEMEQRAADAERASIKYKQVEFLKDREGEVFDGVISGVSEWGIYVELIENKCEGMIPMRELDDDFYQFDEDNYCLVGRKTRKRFQLGDPLKVKVVRANLERRQLDFTIAKDDDDAWMR
jgi:ribonuclease R